MDHLHDVVKSIFVDRLNWPEDIADRLAQCAHIVGYEKDATVFYAGERSDLVSDLVYVLLSGEVKLHYGTPDGERLLVTIARSGQVLGFTDLVTGDASQAERGQPFTAQAQSRCKIGLIARAHVVAALAELPNSEVVRILGDLKEEWVRLSCRLLRFLTMDVRGRLGYAIRDIAEKFGIQDARGTLIGLKLSHEDFAELVGASRPMVSKHLKELATTGVFVKRNARYVLSHLDALDAVVMTKAPRPEPTRDRYRARQSERTRRVRLSPARLAVATDRIVRRAAE